MRSRMLLPTVVIALLSLSASLGLAQDATPEATAEMLEPGPDVILVDKPGLMPEGIEYDSERDALLIGSVTQGTIHAVALDGTLTPLASSDNLTSSAGIEVDEANNRLLAAANVGNREGAALGIYDLETGEELAFVDLTAAAPDAGGYFANDVAVDDAGNAYVTDSAAGVIYQVDREGNASVFLEDASFRGQFVINGIVYHPNGYLLASRANGYVKIPVDDPASFTAVEMPDAVGADGMILLDDTTLITVYRGRVLRIESADNFATAAITGEFSAPGTTVAARGDEVYLVNANFNNPQAESYPLTKVVFTEPEM